LSLLVLFQDGGGGGQPLTADVAENGERHDQADLHRRSRGGGGRAIMPDAARSTGPVCACGGKH
jgi:hypothetical protein